MNIKSVPLPTVDETWHLTTSITTTTTTTLIKTQKIENKKKLKTSGYIFIRQYKNNAGHSRRRFIKYNFYHVRDDSPLSFLPSLGGRAGGGVNIQCSLENSFLSGLYSLFFSLSDWNRHNKACLSFSLTHCCCRVCINAFFVMATGRDDVNLPTSLAGLGSLNTQL